ncbi:hypothetical protein Scep_025561 [Stephania cephalantha]|uniref:Uncharacterized protein n=1 Tax=Stephania cephalantha TaxID=152367 RepID=A0AAP0HRA9_9MAGN
MGGVVEGGRHRVAKPPIFKNMDGTSAAISCGNKRNLFFKVRTFGTPLGTVGERNQRIFKEIDNTWQEIWESTKRNVGLALHGHKEFVGWSWQQWQGNWSDFC